MFFTRDMRDLIDLFHKHDVEYLLVGGFVVGYYGYARTTQDIDFLINPTAENAVRTMRALDEFGFGDAGIPDDFFSEPDRVIHLGSEPNRIDLLTGLKDTDCTELFKHRRSVEIESTPVWIIGFDELIAVKQRSGRLKDQADAEELLKIKQQKS